MSDPMIRSALEAEADRCFAVMTVAFSGDPVVRWAWPDQQRYLEAFPRFSRAFGGGAVGTASAHVAADFAGVALWLPPDTAPDEAAIQAILEETMTGELKDSMFAMFEQMDRYHPKERHWYLPLIGVDPVSQGRGHGSALLRHALAECDRQHLPAYLEATSPRNVHLYARHGFVVSGTIQSGSSPPLTPMLRTPR